LKATILTDSTCDLPSELVARLGLQVVPLYVLFGTESFRDGVTLSNADFFRKLTSSPHHPGTSQPTPEDFLQIYRRIPGPIFSMHLASSLSGTCSSASQAVRLMGEEGARVRVWDSESVTAALGLLAMAAWEAAEEGQDLEGIETHVRQVRQDLKLYFTLETLDHLAKGGRIGRAQALLGGLLKIRPILSFADQSVVPLAKTFGFEQALNRIVDLAAKDHRLKPLRRLFVIHGAAPQAAERLEQKVRERIPGDFEILRTVIGAVIGTHVGPGAAGLAYHS
jgi:DegV family protein with EDD domain